MKISDRGLALIKRAEGLRLDAYKDGGGVLTIGYGSTRDVHASLTITPGEAERRCWKTSSATTSRRISTAARQASASSMR
jgi:GH24 family phage-related lysozyme (muramidase)